MEYDYKNIYQSFNISYFTKDNDLLGHNFVDFQELKDYEHVEDFTSELILIFIKKFKFRLSFKRNGIFSKQIVICDDYDFNPEMLKHEGSIVKIAIVKDDIDKWIYLENFDYIFTFKEHKTELKQYERVFTLIEMSIYNQIKFILNELYRRKANKFYYFLKETNFNKIFPKWNDYFKVLNSDLFDDQWYRDTYNLEKNTDSVVHFLLIGYERGFSPGPNFNTEDYYTCNRDVQLKGLNPLIHYEQYGRKENRIFSIEEKNKRDYDLILNSSYFDKEWYESTYDILDEDKDPVNHYLHIGYKKRYNPSMKFSTHEYFECNNDVKRVLENPLVHYELFGRKEKRRMCLTDEQHQKDYDLISDSPYFDKDWYLDTYDDLNGYDDPVYHYLHVGYTKGFNPGPNFSTDEYHICNPDVKEHGMNPLLHYERYGRREQRKLSLNDI